LAILRHRLSRRHRLATSASVLAELANLLDIARPAVLGHSWGASIAATLPSTGLHPSVIVLVDPPFVTAHEARTLGLRAIGPPVSSYEDARDALLSERPDWHPLDLAAKADALATVSRRVMVGVVAANVPFDPLPALRRARPGGHVPVFVIAGEPDHGSLVSEAGRAGLRAVLGPDHVLVVPGAGHSPHRSHHEEFMALVRGALGAAAP
jgi:pimeloyl-ACP methyl ester carboxylesterase